jgi:BON domain
MGSIQIPEETLERIKAQLRGRVRDLRLLVREGRVVLAGSAPSYYTKQLAQHFVLNSLDGIALVNEIEVRRVVPAPDLDDFAAD